MAKGEAEIRALIDSQIKAVRARDVGGLLASYAPDVLVFDLVNPLEYRGSGARENAQQSGSPRSRGRSDTRFTICASPQAMT